jgi:putative membrane protein
LSGIQFGISQSAAGANVLAGNSGSIVSGASQISSGASQLAAGSPELNSGVSELASGADRLAAGSAGLNSGASDLTSGVSQLATGLQEGADQVPATDADAAAKTADVVVEPVGVNVTTANAVTDVGQGVATFFVPLGLWIGALAVFLVLKPVSRRALASTARNGRLVAASIGRAGVVTALQALLLVGLLHGALGVAWSLLPATLLFSIITALAFTAFHYLLTIGLGRGGLVVSLFALAIQVTSTGGIYPVELLSTPFQVISPFLPLTWAVSGMQGIIAGGVAGTVVSSALILLAFGVGSVILALFAIRRTRRADVLGLVPLPA